MVATGYPRRDERDWAQLERGISSLAKTRRSKRNCTGLEWLPAAPKNLLLLWPVRANLQQTMNRFRFDNRPHRARRAETFSSDSDQCPITNRRAASNRRKTRARPAL